MGAYNMQIANAYSKGERTSPLKFQNCMLPGEDKDLQFYLAFIISKNTFQLKPSTASVPSLAYIRAGHPLRTFTYVLTDGEGSWTKSRLSKRGCVDSVLQICSKCEQGEWDTKSPKIGHVLNGWPLSVRFQNWTWMTKGPRRLDRPLVAVSRFLEKSGAVCSFSFDKF